ncbi:hypothetical protein [Spirosoma arcticum]
MQPVKAAAVFSFLLIALCACEEPPITRQEPQAKGARGFTPPRRENDGDITTSPGGQPYPTITEQTFIPEDSQYAQLKTLTWRIEWPNYPAGTDPNKIPTVFTLSNGALNSFDYLNSQSASNTYKTNFNLYHNAKLETATTLLDELPRVCCPGNQMEATSFNQAHFYNPVQTIQHIVTERPDLFESYHVDNSQEPAVYQQGDVFFFKLTEQHRYGAIRIVSMTPRIIEVYLAVPNI